MVYPGIHPGTISGFFPKQKMPDWPKGSVQHYAKHQTCHRAVQYKSKMPNRPRAQSSIILKLLNK